MNSFCSMFGSDDTGWNRIKCVIGIEVDNNWSDIRKFRKSYHTLGNFLLIPNRKNINRVKGTSGRIKDSFELFLSNAYMYYCEKENNTNKSILFGYRMAFKKNIEYKKMYDKDFLFKNKSFYLQDYFDSNGDPTDLFFDYKGLSFRKTPDKYSNEEKIQYKEAVNIYLKVCNTRIENRSNIMAEELFARMEEYNSK